MWSAGRCRRRKRPRNYGIGPVGRCFRIQPRRRPVVHRGPAGGSAVRADRKRFGSTPGGWKVRFPIVPNLQPVGSSGAVRGAVPVGWPGYVGGMVNVARSVANRLIMLLHMAAGIAIGVFQLFQNLS